MISFHRDTLNIGDEAKYWRDFEPANIDEIDRVALGITRFAWSGTVWTAGRRRRENFIRADWCVLDFDDGAMTLEQAKRSFVDCIHIIGTTKSHQKVKEGKPPVDRFRVAVRFDEPIENLLDYEATMQHYVRIYGSDDSCTDGARFFWPCTAIVQMASFGYTFETFIAPPPPQPKDYSQYAATKTMPRWIEGYLKLGLPNGDRNNMCNKLGYYLSQCGFSVDEIVTAIVESPTDRTDMSLDEVVRAVSSGVKAGARRLSGQE